MTLADAIARLLEAPLVDRAPTPLATRDAIVVLGARLTARGRLTPALAERVATAAALWHAGAGRWVIPTGGPTGGARVAEADAMAAALIAAGVAPDAVIVERAAQTTEDNARLTAALLAPLGAHAIWLVTQPFHARRATRLFRKVGLDARAWHIADSLQFRDRRRAIRWLVREYAAWAKLVVTGWPWRPAASGPRRTA